MIDNKEKRRRNLISKIDNEIIINIPITEKNRCLFKKMYESLREKERIIPINTSNNINIKFTLSICFHQSLISKIVLIKLMRTLIF